MKAAINRTFAFLLALSSACSGFAADAGLIAEGSKPLKLAGGFKFTEGPAAGPDGNVYFTDIPNNRIHKWDVKAGKLSTFLEKSGGANGLHFSKECDLFACQG